MDVSNNTETETKENLLFGDQEERATYLLQLFSKEKKFFFYNPNAKYVKFRRVIVDWMCEVGEEFHLATRTIHMAIKYLDRILGTIEVGKKRLQLVAMCCILVAAKYDEPEKEVPTIEDLNECSENTYTPEMIKNMELVVLQGLNWNLGVVVPVTFLQLFMQDGIVFPSDTVNSKPVTKRVVSYLKKYVDFFAYLCELEYSLQQYYPSILTGAIIACSRTALRIDPVWNRELSIITKMSDQDVYSCYFHLWGYYEKNFPTSRVSASTPPLSPGFGSPVSSHGYSPMSISSPSTPITPSSPFDSPSNMILLSPSSPEPSSQGLFVQHNPKPQPVLSYLKVDHPGKPHRYKPYVDRKCRESKEI